LPVIDTSTKLSPPSEPGVDDRNLVRIALISVALLIGLNAVGIDLTAFAVFSGAVGVGIGFGLQKIVSNFVSGIILLLERSIKAGDVIEVGTTFGSSRISERATPRCEAETARKPDPEREPDHNQVVNWSYSSCWSGSMCRSASPITAILHAVRELAVEVAKRNEARARLANARLSLDPIRRQRRQSAASLLDSRIPQTASTNIKGAVLLGLWSIQRAPDRDAVPQREVRIRDLPPAAVHQRVPESEVTGEGVR